MRLFRVAVGPNSRVIDDNAIPRYTVPVADPLQRQVLQRMDCPATSLNLNHVNLNHVDLNHVKEHVWNRFGRSLAERDPAPSTIRSCNWR